MLRAHGIRSRQSVRAMIGPIRCCPFIVRRRNPYPDRLWLDHDSVNVGLDQIAIIEGGRMLGHFACCKVVTDAVDHELLDFGSSHPRYAAYLSLSLL
jgi:hypothetical protein